MFLIKFLKPNLSLREERIQITWWLFQPISLRNTDQKVDSQNISNNTPNKQQALTHTAEWNPC